MTAFEDFVNTELPQRPVLIKGAVEAAGDPRSSVVPKVLGAPIGTLYQQYGTVDTWKRIGTGAEEWFKFSSGRAIYDTTIFVDPVLGDDDISNDGTVTPFKTIRAAFDRIPSTVGGNNEIRLSAGVHDLSTATDNYWFLPEGWSLSGWYEPDEDGFGWPRTFEFTSYAYSATEFTLSKDPLTTPWIVNEHVGKYVCYIFDVSGLRTTALIHSNTEHDLRVTSLWTPILSTNCWISEIQTTIANAVSGINIICPQDQDIGLIKFDNNEYLNIYANGSNIYYCSFTNPIYNGLECVASNATSYIHSCSFINNSSEALYLSGAVTYVYCNSVHNSVWSVESHSFDAQFYNNFFSNITTYCYWIYSNSWVRNEHYLDTVANFAYFDTAFIECGLNVQPIGTSKPTGYMARLVGGATVGLQSSHTLESNTAANTFYVNGRAVSLSDMKNKYQRNYLGPGNARVVAI